MLACEAKRNKTSQATVSHLTGIVYTLCILFAHYSDT